MDFDSSHVANNGCVSDRALTIARAVELTANPMGASLKDYIKPKVHQLIRERTWRQIIVIGKHARQAPYIIADSEKRDKRFNWQRPTARIVSPDVLEVACFPGRDYVKHYGILIASFCEMVGRTDTIVRYDQDPDIHLSPIVSGNVLDGLGKFQTVIIGYVDRLVISATSLADWEQTSSDEDDLFAWRKSTDGYSVALLGCMPSFWGDISVQIVQALARLGTETIFYCGKAGTLDASIEPNQWIATGSASLVGNELIQWESSLTRDISTSNKVKEGVHINTASPLENEYPAPRRHRGIDISWIDCEIGLMARQCNSLGVSFAYLHIVSDNLALEREYGLWNERIPEVTARRKVLMREISGILDAYVERQPGTGAHRSNCSIS